MTRAVTIQSNTHEYDALLVLSFGGPEGPDEVLPFLENVLRGKNVPRARMLEVAEHYQHFDGVSPINQQCRELVAALQGVLTERGPDLPIYWGNRNWHPLLRDTLLQMRDDGVKRALAFVTSVFSSYSGCRQYLDDISRAQAEIGTGPPAVDKLRSFFNHPRFIATMQDRVTEAMSQIPADRQRETQIVFTAHSIPAAMANGCAYEKQLRESCRLVADSVPHGTWQLVYQSRSGPPTQEWLGPDICQHLRELRAGNCGDVVIVPIGFVSDHMEVLFDLDTEAQQVCDEIGLNAVRAKTAGTHPEFVEMIRELILERIAGAPARHVGLEGPSQNDCPSDCCPSGRPKQPL